MPRATFLTRPGKRDGSRISLKNMIRKLIEKHLIQGWGKRQLLKLGLVIAPILAVSNEQIEGTVAVIIAGALMVIEIIFSKLNAKKLASKK
tara:strand:+ start:2546 stop:2818 length:273 start_codon:yes stop_codon:yes gene_type:complete